MKNHNLTPQHIANYFLTISYGRRVITPLKLMKLVYFSYAWYLYLTGTNLFNEDIQAWKHGPVIPSLFHEFKRYGLNGEIESQLATYIDLNQDDGESIKPFIDSQTLKTDKLLNHAIVGVWEFYKDFSGEELRDITHEKDTVWSKNYKKLENIVINRKISDIELIKERAKVGYSKAMAKLKQ